MASHYFLFYFIYSPISSRFHLGLLLTKWSRKHSDQKWFIICKWMQGAMRLLHCRKCWIVLCEQVCTAGLVSHCVAAAHTELSRVLNRKMQSVLGKHARVHSLDSHRALNFQFDSHWFNMSQLKPTAPKGNQCNRFLGSPLFLWFPLAQTSLAPVIN